MKTKTNILPTRTLRTVMMLIMMVWANSMLGQETITATWNFRSNTTSDYFTNQFTYQGTNHNEEYIASDNADLKLKVDASTGKFSTSGRNDWAQINAGTKIYVPVISKDDEVSITTYAGSILKVNGTVITGKDYTHTVTNEELKAKYVMFECTSNSYLGSVKVVQHVPVTPGVTEVEERNAKWSWRNNDEGCLTETNFQNTKGTLVSNGIEMTVDATGSSCKLTYNSSGYAQFNANTIISIPVRHAGDIITVEAYTGQYNFTVGGTAATANTTTYTATAADVAKGHVDVIATKTAYLYYITLKQIAYTIGAEPADPLHSIYDYKVTTTDELKNALESANGTASKRCKIFIQNGTYNLGTSYGETNEVKDYTTLIGESRDGVIIENHPEKEGIWTSSTLMTGSHIVMQNLTIRCNAIKGSSDNTNAERGTALYEKGSDNVYRNVRLLSRQDTYYSESAVNSYFEDCEIHGTVDFICGSGNAWFEKCTIVAESSSNIYIVAPRTNEGEKGYFFNQCIITKAEGATINNFYLGRGWSEKPKTVFANCKAIINGKEQALPYDYNKSSWADGKVHDASDADGMTVQNDALDANATMGAVASTGKPLPAPANVTIKGNTLTWETVDNASGYAIYKDNTLLVIVDKDINFFDLGINSESRGMATIAQTTSASSSYSVAAVSADGIVGTNKVAKQPTYFTIHFEKGNDVSGTLPNDITKDNTETTSVEVKANNSLYKEGHTFIGWNDGTKTYNVGTTATFTNKDITLTAEFRKNEKSLSTRTGETTIKWDMSQTVGINYSGNGNIYVTQATIDDETIDVKLDINGTFKTNNSWIALDGTSIIFPSAKGATVEFESYVNPTGTTINSEALQKIEAIQTNDFKTTHKINSSGTTGELKFSGNPYIKYLKITYPEPPVYVEKLLYNTDFTDWEEINRKEANEVTVNKKTDFSDETLTFTFTGVGVYPKESYMQTAKYEIEFSSSEPNVITSPLASITKIWFYQVAKGGKRGIKISVKGDGDTDWVVLHDKSIATQSGEEITLTVNRTNCQIKFENHSEGPKENAYVTDLKIYGNIEQTKQKKIIYYDTKGEKIYETEKDENTIFQFEKGESDITLPTDPEGFYTYKFRGWFDSKENTAKKITEGFAIKENVYLFAKATKIENPVSGSEYTYDFQHETWYAEDHEALKLTGATPHDSHGMYFKNAGNMTLTVAKNASIEMTLCQYSSDEKITIDDEEGNEITNIPSKVAKDGDKETFAYEYQGSNATTQLTFNIPSNTYIHGMTVRNYKYVKVDFEKKPSTIDGDYPTQSITCDKNCYAELPSYNLCYRKGWTITGWVDANTGKEYSVGKQHFEDNVTLRLNMRQNTYSITDTNSDIDAVWYFDKNVHKEVPSLNLQKQEVPYTIPARIKISDGVEENIDLPLTINTTEGKVTNMDETINSYEGEGGQFNSNTRFTLPAVYGMTITVHASDKVDERFNISTHFGDKDDDAQITLSEIIKTGNNDDERSETVEYKGFNGWKTASTDGKTLTFIYKGDCNTVELKVLKAGSVAEKEWGFYKDITVKYPTLPTVNTINVISNLDATTFPNEQAANAGEVTVSHKDPATPRNNTGKRYAPGDKVSLTVKPAYGYDIDKVEASDGTAITADETESADKTTESADKTYSYTLKALTGTDFATANDVKVYFTRKTMYKVTATASDKSLGTPDLYPVYKNFYQKVMKKNDDGSDSHELDHVESWYTANTEVTASAQAIEDYKVDYWTEEGSETKTNNDKYTITMGTAAKSLIVHFKPGEKGNVIFQIFNKNGENVCDPVNGVTAGYKDAGSIEPMALYGVRSFTVPTNFTFFKNVDNNGDATKEGYTLKYWVNKSDETKHYDLGKRYSFDTEDETITLIPYFGEKNPADQTTRFNNPVIRYDFGRRMQEYLDPTTGETRMVCAQSVNIGKDSKMKQFFWTTKVWVESLVNGDRKDHWRDVAIWCDLGKRGYIRNNELNSWCAFGPGTTLWFASGRGTEVSMLTYSPITTTTIGGVVPELDEAKTAAERAKPENADIKDHLYIYTYTTTMPDLRVPIVIGDDYSYYQWIETATPASNMVNLKAKLGEGDHGTLTEVKSTSKLGVTEKIDGSYDCHQGDRIEMTFSRKFGYMLDKIIDPDKTDADGNPFAALKMNYDDNTVEMVAFNDDGNANHTSVSVKTNGTTTDDDGRVIETWGKNATEENGGTVFTLTKIEPTEQEKRDSIYTKYIVSYNITTDRELLIEMKTKDTYYITYNAGQYASGAAPVPQWVEAGDKFKIPKNNTLYYEGNTLRYWTDENYDNTKSVEENEDAGHVYRADGREYNAPDHDMRMFPVFTPNEFNILEVKGHTDTDDKNLGSTAVWHLSVNGGAPTIAYERNEGILVTQLYEEGTDADGKGIGRWIDLKVDLDAKNGKFNNTDAKNPDRMQVNAGSIIQFPSSEGCVVKLTAQRNFEDYPAAIDGKKKGDEGVTLGNENKAYFISAICSGAEAQKKLEVLGSTYCYDFTITYMPQEATETPQIASLSCHVKKDDTTEPITLNTEEIEQMMNSNRRCIHFTVSPWEDNEQLPTITGTATNGGTVEATKATIATGRCDVTLKTAGGVIVKTYPVEFDYTTPPEDNCPKIVKVNINGVDCNIDDISNGITVDNAPRSGAIIITFSRTMKADDADSKDSKDIIHKYWNAEAGKPLAFNVTSGRFVDIYGRACDQTLNITLNIISEQEQNHHHNFDFIVDESDADHTLAKAIEAANNHVDNGHRFYIFVPDGEYFLEGNEPLTDNEYWADSNGVWPKDKYGVEHKKEDMVGKTNGRTLISKPNVSLIGQSREGVIIKNEPTVEGISYTSTLHIGKDAKDFYAEDLSLVNMYDYWATLSAQGSAGAGRAVVIKDQGNRTILKNVSMMSWQDTYYTANSADHRIYLEDCVIGGVVDWICGDGDVWFENCDLLVRDRSGNNLTAPAQEEGHEWGYIFNNCTIKPETNNPTLLKGEDWTLARPWNGRPACTFLNTKMVTRPRPAGWGTMNTNRVIRFHEYGTMDEHGDLVSLSRRSLAACMPAAGSDECVITKEQADKYTIQAVMGGTDGFEPEKLCEQLDADSGMGMTASGDGDMIDIVSKTTPWKDNIALDDDELVWDLDDRALCYFVFKLDAEGNWKYIVNTTENSVNLYNYGTGKYCVRAANQRGGLGEATKAIEFVIHDSYKLDIKKQVGDEEGYGYTTICLPFNARVPEGIKVYAVTAHDKESADEKVTDFWVTLTEVDVINAEKGYVAYGPLGSYYFRATSRETLTPTILTGNPTNMAIPAMNHNGYVLAEKTYGVGFYKYAGSTLAAYRAWMPYDMVSVNVQESMVSGTRAIRMMFKDAPTGLHHMYKNVMDEDATYNLSGQRTNASVRNEIIVSRKNGKVIRR